MRAADAGVHGAHEVHGMHEAHGVKRVDRVLCIMHNQLTWFTKLMMISTFSLAASICSRSLDNRTAGP